MASDLAQESFYLTVPFNEADLETAYQKCLEDRQNLVQGDVNDELIHVPILISLACDLINQLEEVHKRQYLHLNLKYEDVMFDDKNCRAWFNLFDTKLHPANKTQSGLVLQIDEKTTKEFVSSKRLTANWVQERSLDNKKYFEYSENSDVRSLIIVLSKLINNFKHVGLVTSSLSIEIKNYLCELQNGNVEAEPNLKMLREKMVAYFKKLWNPALPRKSQKLSLLKTIFGFPNQICAVLWCNEPMEMLRLTQKMFSNNTITEDDQDDIDVLLDYEPLLHSLITKESEVLELCKNEPNGILTALLNSAKKFKTRKVDTSEGKIKEESESTGILEVKESKDDNTSYLYYKRLYEEFSEKSGDRFTKAEIESILKSIKDVLSKWSDIQKEFDQNKITKIRRMNMRSFVSSQGKTVNRERTFQKEPTLMEKKLNLDNSLIQASNGECFLLLEGARQFKAQHLIRAIESWQIPVPVEVLEKLERLNETLTSSEGSHFNLGKAIGRGSSSIVKFAVHLKTGKLVACKIMRTECLLNSNSKSQEFTTKSFREAWENEAMISDMMGLSLGSAELGKTYYIFQHFLFGRSIESLIEDKAIKNWAEVLRFMFAAYIELGKMHSKGIFHMDLAIRNVNYCKSTWNVFFLDFGLALKPTRLKSGKLIHVSLKGINRITGSDCCDSLTPTVVVEVDGGHFLKDVVLERHDIYSLSQIIYKLSEHLTKIPAEDSSIFTEPQFFYATLLRYSRENNFDQMMQYTLQWYLDLFRKLCHTDLATFTSHVIKNCPILKHILCCMPEKLMKILMEIKTDSLLCKSPSLLVFILDEKSFCEHLLKHREQYTKECQNPLIQALLEQAELRTKVRSDIPLTFSSSSTLNTSGTNAHVTRTTAATKASA